MTILCQNCKHWELEEEEFGDCNQIISHRKSGHQESNGAAIYENDKYSHSLVTGPMFGCVLGETK